MTLAELINEYYLMFPDNTTNSNYGEKSFNTLLSMLQSLDLAESDKDGDTIVHKIALLDYEFCTGDFHNLFGLIINTRKYDINTRNKAGNTVLHCMLLHKDNYNFAHIKMMIDMGAKIDIQNAKHQTALQLMVIQLESVLQSDHKKYYESREIFKQIIDYHGINIDSGSPTVFQTLINEQSFHRENISFLGDIGADLSLLNSKNLSIVHRLIQMQPYLILDDDLELIRKVCSITSELINIRDPKGRSPIQMLLNKQCFSLKELLCLLELGANCSLEEQVLWLHHQFLRQELSDPKMQQEIVHYLKIGKLTVNGKNDKGLTSLDLILEEKTIDLTVIHFLLVQCGAEFNNAHNKEIDKILSAEFINNSKNHPLIMDIVTHWNSNCDLHSSQFMQDISQKCLKHQPFLARIFCQLTLQNNGYDNCLKSVAASFTRIKQKEFREIAVEAIVAAAKFIEHHKSPQEALDFLDKAVKDDIVITHNAIGFFLRPHRPTSAERTIKDIRSLIEKNHPPQNKLNSVE